MIVYPRPTHLFFYSARSLKQQSASTHVAPSGHIILFPSQPVFAFNETEILLNVTFNTIDNTINTVECDI
jgi:hypothetical protein